MRQFVRLLRPQTPKYLLEPLALAVFGRVCTSTFLMETSCLVRESRPRIAPADSLSCPRLARPPFHDLRDDFMLQMHYAIILMRPRTLCLQGK